MMGELRDAAGTVHRTIEGRARIVSLVPSVTELLFDLDLGPQVVGRTTFCVHPRHALAGIPKVGGTKTLRLDRLEALAPSHVIVNVDENRLEDVEAMSRFVPSIVVTHPVAPRDNIELFALIGGIFDRGVAARRLARTLEGELALTARAAGWLPARKVLYLIWREPWMTVSRSTYISRMLALVNWETVGHDAHTRYPEVDLAGDSARAADVVLLSSEPFPFRTKHVPELRRVLPPETEIAFIDGEYASWYGSRAPAGVRYLRELAMSRAGRAQATV
jgi:ABC-type Fe3+-hydroxamate transport system substrate-binding protein